MALGICDYTINNDRIRLNLKRKESDRISNSLLSKDYLILSKLLGVL